MSSLRVRHILVADDEKIMRNVVVEALKSRGVYTSEAEDGVVAFNVIKIHENLPNKIDLLITDLKMPLLSGLELVRRLRRRGINIPAVVMSGNFDVKTIEDLISRIEVLCRAIFP